MSTVADLKTEPQTLPPEDPFYYGWRDVPMLQPDGTHKSVQIPLTLEDHLHPQMDDHFMEGHLHDYFRDYLGHVFRWRVKSDPTALVLCNTGVYWDDPELGHHAPDVAVIFGVRQPRPPRQTWESFQVAEEGTRPRTIIELVSPAYRRNDVVDKFEAYHRAGVLNYVILDRLRRDDPWSIKAYRRNPYRYVLQPLEENGRFWLEDLNLWLAVDGMDIRCYDGDTGEEIKDYSGLAEEKQQFQKLAESEKKRAEAEKARAESEKVRAENEKALAETEKARADDAERRLRDAEALIEQLKKQQPGF